jgi:DNA adenine methylase
MKSPIRYAGGKSKAIKHIYPYLYGKNKIISPFVGGGSIEAFAASKGSIVIGSDIFEPLVCFWKQILSNPIKLADKLSEITPTENEYDRIKEILIQWEGTQDMLKNWSTDYYKRTSIKLDEIDIAAYYFFNHNVSYGPGYLGWASSLYLNQKSWDKMIDKVKWFVCNNFIVHQSSFEESIIEHSNEFLYLDPPYYLDKCDGNKMFKGLYPMRNIPVHHESFPHEKLRDLLHNHKGGFVLSYNNCDVIREYYKDFEQVFPSWNYSMGNGETRIGKNREEANVSNKKESHEILIIKR